MYGILERLFFPLERETGAAEVEVVAQRFRECLSAGGNVSVYMFHGGSTFGWMNGASHEMGYQPIVTSYDYGALLTEAGIIRKSTACSGMR